MFSSKVIYLKLFRDDSQRIQITGIKLGHEKVYSTFGSLSEKLLTNHTILFSKLKENRTSLSFEKKRTVSVVLESELAKHYVKDDHLEYLGKRLLSVADSKSKEKTFGKKMRDLTFNPKVDSIHRFLSCFKEIVSDRENGIVLTYLKGKIPIDDLPALKDKFALPIEKLYDELVKFYAGKFDRERTALNGLKLSDAASLEDFLAKKFKLFEYYLPGVSMPERISSILSELPREIFDEFVDGPGGKVPKVYRTQKESFLSYLQFVAKQHSRCLNGLPLTESDRMKVKFTDMPHPSKQPQNKSITESNGQDDLDMSVIESKAGADQFAESTVRSNPTGSEEFTITMDFEEEDAIPFAYPSKVRFDLFQQVLDRSSN